MLKKTLAFIMSVFFVLSMFNISFVFADEGSSTGPKAILSDPYFDLNSVDEGVLSAWYSSEITVNDESLRKALQNAAKVDTLTVEAMFSLPTTLNLSGMNISDLTGLEYAINVSELDISGNNITSLDPIKNLYNLTSLNYANNSVNVVPSWIFSSRMLETVNGSGNDSSVIEEFSVEGSALKSLYLEDNELSALPNMGGLTSLEIFSLSDNDFSLFPDALRSMSNLKVLSLNNNKLENVGDISGLTALASLYLSNNKIHTIPSGIETLPALSELQLSGNSITTVGDSFSLSESLESVNLSFNNLTELPESLLNAKFTMLDVGMNKINVSENSDILNKLSSHFDEFYYSMQFPELTVELVYDSDAPAGKLKWNLIPDVITEDGNYKVVSVIIERKDKNVTGDTSELSDQSDATQTTQVIDDNGSASNDEMEMSPTIEGESQSDQGGVEQQEDKDAEVVMEGNVPKLSRFEQVGEVEPAVCEFIDKSALSTSEYVFRVTVYIEGEYRDGISIQTQLSDTISSNEITTDSSNLRIKIYIGVVVSIIAVMIGIISHLSSKKAKKTVKKKENSNTRLETARKHEKRSSVDMSKVGTQESLEDELDKILSTSDDELKSDVKKNPMEELYKEVKNSKKNNNGMKK